MQIDPIQIALSAGLFLFLWRTLGAGVFRRHFALLEEREARTVGDEARAVAIIKEREALEFTLQQELKSSRVNGIALREELVGRAKLEAEKLTEQARAQAQQKLELAHAEIERLKNAARRELENDTARISASILSRVLETESSRVIH